MADYEAPKIMFEELNFFEKIADKCWGASKVTFDNPFDSSRDSYSMSLSGGCDRGQLDPSGSVLDFVKTYMSSSQYDSWTACNSSNMSNTHASGFNCHSGYNPTPTPTPKPTPTPTPIPCDPNHPKPTWPWWPWWPWH